MIHGTLLIASNIVVGVGIIYYLQSVEYHVSSGSSREIEMEQHNLPAGKEPQLSLAQSKPSLPSTQEVTTSTSRAPVVLDKDRERANKWDVLVLAAVGAFMTTLDASIVTISLPSIAHSFGVALTSAIEWTIIGYLVITAAV